jgi:hypothetical protein
MIPFDISALPPEVQKEFIECRHNKEVLALAGASREQDALAAEMRASRLDERRSIDGLGAPILEITPTAFHYWGQRFGTYECWRDKQFLREFKRDNPEARIRAHGTKIQVASRWP